MTAQAANIATQRCAAGAPLLQVASLVKRFPGVVAVDDVSLDLQPGVVLALLGQNGAGKSTLIQVLSGIHVHGTYQGCLLYTSPSPRDGLLSRMPSSA